MSSTPTSTMSFLKSTTKRFPRSSVDRREQQATCPRSQTPHRGSQRRTLLAISKPSPPSGESQPRASWSRTSSDGCSALSSISESQVRTPMMSRWTARRT